MSTLGYLFIIVALLGIRGMTKGRSITQLPGDLGDAFTAAIQGNTAGVSEALNRTGDSQTPATAESVASLAANPNSPTTGEDAQIVAYARSKIGKPYVWGATGPDAFDCSGLAQAACKSVGISIPRTTYQQIMTGTLVQKADLQLGDLVFPDIAHVQIYSGNGNVIEAPHAGSVVREVPMWGYMSARRVVTNAPFVNGTGT